VKIVAHHTRCVCTKKVDVLIEVDETHYLRLLPGQKCSDCGNSWSFAGKLTFNGKDVIDVGGAIVIIDERPV
jgi:ArsR family metal-binding transcriptional regulator